MTAVAEATTDPVHVEPDWAVIEDNAKRAKELAALAKANPIIPDPVGWRILVAIPKAEDTYEGSNLVKVAQAKQAEEVTSIVGLVIAMGPDAFGGKNGDESRFPTGPYCEEGDYVMFQAYSGTRFGVEDQEFRIISDENIRAVVKDPRKVRRVG